MHGHAPGLPASGAAYFDENLMNILMKIWLGL
jgi:hypothetical protein